MDIIETLTEALSEEKQLETHLARVEKYREEGYAVVEQADGEIWIYPKNAATGEPSMEAMATKLWAIPALTPDDTYEIPAAVDVTPDFVGVEQADYVVRDRPAEWQDPVMMEDTKV